MNYEEFEQAILADPNSNDPELLAKEAECEHCAALADKARKLDQRLKGAFDVPVPDSQRGALPDMAALVAESESRGDNVVELGARKKPSFAMPAWIGLAACVALVSALVLRQPEVMPEAGATEQALIAQMIEQLGTEMDSMVPSDVRVSASRVSNILRPVGASMDVAPGPISYAKNCVVNGELVPHLVVQGERGPVTILVMQKQMVDGPVSIVHGEYEGVILPVGETGSIAIIGHDAESVEAVRAGAGETLGLSI